MVLIRKSRVDDLERIMPVYESAKGYMRKEGNMSQWTGGYPSEEVILKDIAAGVHYIVERDAEDSAGNELPADNSVEECVGGSGLAADNSVKECVGREVLAVFTFIIGKDPTYGFIEGAWLDEEPYGTIHRIASSGKESGMLGKCVDFCFGLIPNIRIDTHKDNRSMLAGVSRLGFERCGVIYLADGAPRVAFQRHLNSPDMVEDSFMRQETDVR